MWLLWFIGNLMSSGKKASVGIRKKDLPRFLLCGLMGVAINQMFFIKGITYTTPIHASLLMLLTPLMITVFAFWFLKEKITLIKVLGILLGISGSLLLILSKELSVHAGDYLKGDLLIAINATAYTFYFIMVKPLMQDYPPLHVIRWVFTFGFIMILPFGWNEVASIEWQQLDWTHYASLFFIIFFGTFLAYYFNIYGIQHLGAGTTGSYIYTQPIFAALIAIIFLKEMLTIEKIISGVLIFTGVFLVSVKKSSFNAGLGVIEE